MDNTGRIRGVGCQGTSMGCQGTSLQDFSTGGFGISHVCLHVSDVTFVLPVLALVSSKNNREALELVDTNIYSIHLCGCTGFSLNTKVIVCLVPHTIFLEITVPFFNQIKVWINTIIV